ncbi:MAG: peptidoglycan DD-metalloendopeptidase family protein [Candidatus Omnitrophica bacterium]|nr:peptidoglycan DD-metalloendopeptidase family protein [Candidatus Omnitrophota bacterium]
MSTRPPAPPQGLKGIYHQVKPGQSLWRISQAYQVELEKIARLNRLSDTSRIYSGQLIFIPGANREIEDLTLSSDFKGAGGDFIWPVKGKVTSFFGMKKDEVKNKGISIQAGNNELVLAARSGRISFATEALNGYGKVIMIDHLDGYSTVYAQHTQNLVKLNQLVRQGEKIARTSVRGEARCGEVYFEIRKGLKPQNPFFYLP